MMSAIPPPVTQPPRAVRAVRDLREARERLGLSLQQVASTLRIRPPHLQALEQGDVSLLPSYANALAFVRSYANLLGLDAAAMVRRFKTEARAADRHAPLVFPVPLPERALPAGAAVLLGVVLAIGAYAGWYHLSGEGRLAAETVATIPQRLASLAEQALPPATEQALPPATGASAAVRPSALTVDEPALKAPTAELPAEFAASQPPADPAPSVATISPTSAAAAQLPQRPLDEASVAVAWPRPQLGGRAPNQARILLHAGADAWLLVTDPGGAVLLNRTLKAGETWPVPARADLLLTTGNAGGTEIVVDGATAPSLGGNGAVRRDLLLDPDQIKDGRPATSAQPSLESAPALASARPRQ